MDKLVKRALLLEYFTVGYNIVEAAVSLLAGAIAGSIALTGFGLDSIVESLSGLVLIWRLKKHNLRSEREEEKIERRAILFVGMTFVVLGLYVAYESAMKIIRKEIPDTSYWGMAIALLSVIIMPLLGSAKYKLGKRLKLESLIADSKETFVCAVLSAALLLGLSANALFGFWLADPIVGLIVVAFLFKEGVELLFEKKDS